MVKRKSRLQTHCGSENYSSTNQWVGGSSPSFGTIFIGGIAKWSNAADCKSVPSGSMVQIHVPPPFNILPRSQVVRHQTLTLTFRWFEPTRGSHSYFWFASSVGRAFDF